MWANCSELARFAHRGLDKARAWNVPAIFGEFGAAAEPAGGPGSLFAAHVSRIVSVNGQSWAWWFLGPQDAANTKALLSESLEPRPAVEALRANLRVFHGAECG